MYSLEQASKLYNTNAGEPVTGLFAVGLFAVGHFAVGHFAVRTLRRTDTLPYGHFAVRTFRREETSP